MWYWGFLSRLLDCLYVAHARSVQDTTARYRNQVHFKVPAFYNHIECSKDQLIRSATDRVVERQRIASPGSTLHSLCNLALSVCSDIQRADQPLLIFPEGTTTNGRCMGTYQRYTCDFFMLSAEKLTHCDR